MNCFYCGKTVYIGTGKYIEHLMYKRLVHKKCNIIKKGFKKEVVKDYLIKNGIKYEVEIIKEEKK